MFAYIKTSVFVIRDLELPCYTSLEISLFMYIFNLLHWSEHYFISISSRIF